MAGPSGYAQQSGWTVGVESWLDGREMVASRYWRAIEYGSHYWSDHKIVGLWGASAGTNERPNSLIAGNLDPFRTSTTQKFVPFFGEDAGPQDLLRAGRAALQYFFGMGGSGGVQNATPGQLALLHPKNSLKRDHNGRMYSRGTGPAAQRRVLFWLLTRARLEQMPFVQTRKAIAPITAGDYYKRTFKSFQPLQYELAELGRRLIPTFRGLNSGGQPLTIDSSRGLQVARAQVGRQSGQTPRAGTRGGGALSEADVRGLYGANDGLATMSASAYLRDFTRTGGGLFSSWQSMVREVNAKVAKEFQAAVVADMRKKRTGRPMTEDLIKMTEDPQNRWPQI